MNELILVESRAAREEKLSHLDDNRAIDTLCKAKALVMAVWQGQNIATTVQMAEYFEVPEDTVQKTYQRNREELALDGVKTIKGKGLRDVVDKMSTSQTRIPSLTLWTPRAALRLGMLLRDSSVAQQVRTTLLDVVEIQPEVLEQYVTHAQLEERLKVTPALPQGNIDPIPQPMAPMSERAMVERLINTYAYNQTSRKPLGHAEIRRWMYRELKYRYKYDAYARVKKTGKAKIDQIEADGQLPNLLAICNHLLKTHVQTHP